MRAIVACLALLGVVALAQSSGASQPFRTLIVGDFGPENENMNTLPSPSLPVGSFVPDQRGWAVQTRQAARFFASTARLQYSQGALDVPVIVNTQGRLSVGAPLVAAALSNSSFDAVVVSDSASNSAAIQTMVVEKLGTSALVVFTRGRGDSANLGSQQTVPFIINNDFTDVAIADGLLTALKASGWQALSLVASPGRDGDDFLAAVDSALGTRQTPPRVLSRTRLVGWQAPNRDTADEAVVMSLTQSGARGVLVGGEYAAVRMLNAHDRVKRQLNGTQPEVDELFFVFSRADMATFPVLGTSSPANHAVFVPQFTELSELSRYVDATAQLDQGFAFMLSYLLDGLNLVAAVGDRARRAGSQGPLSSFVADAEPSVMFTGSMRVDGQGQRVTAANMSLMRLQGLRRSPVVAASVDATGTASLGVSPVPASTQTVVEVCLMGSDSCADYANVAHALFALLDSRTRRQAPLLPIGVSLAPIPLAAGTTGVRAINAIARNAHTCDFLIGPSRTQLAIAINPLVTYYGVPTLDYGSTSPRLSDKVVYPYFSRTVPTEMQFARAVAGTFKHFGWDSVAVITSQDVYGAGIVDEYTTALNEVAIGLEQSYLLDPHDATNKSVADALVDIRANLITRIVVVALPASDAQLSLLFDAIANLNMKGTHYFLFSDTVCQFLALRPSLRADLIGSLCVVPQTNAEPIVPPNRTEARALLADGGFSTSTCSMDFVDMYSAFAHDAALVVIDTIGRMFAKNGNSMQDSRDPSRTIFQNGTATVAEMRASTLRSGLTGSVRFDAKGDRSSVAFGVQVQQRGQIVTFGTWSESVGFRVEQLDSPLTWADNTTEVPKSSTRSVSFIAARTAQKNPAVIAVSVLGFIFTIALFVFCCKYQQLKKQAAGVTSSDTEMASRRV